MKQLLLFCVLATVMIIASSCSKDKKSSCGNQVTNLLKAADLDRTHYYSNNQVHLTFSSPLIENVCADEHIEITGSVSLKSHTVPAITTKLFANYLILFEREIPFIRKDTIPATGTVDYIHDGILGLKQAFGSDPGVFILSMEVIFNTLGDYQKDSTYFNNLLTDMLLTATYKEHKP